MNKQPFIFAIAYDCGIILRKTLESFQKYHDHTIHVFGTFRDFKELGKFKNIEYVDLSTDDVLREHFKGGHAGTSYIWAQVINGDVADSDTIIQIDSDTIFMDECVSDITSKFDEGYDLIGQRRSYKNNPNNMPEMEQYEDVVGTSFVGFRKSKITKRAFNDIHRMCGGYYNPLNHPIIDFFDPISFDILHNGGKIFHLDSKDYGSTDSNGSFDNGYLALNTYMDYGKKFAHFAGIGSGRKFSTKGNGTVPVTYTEWAKSRYAIYMKLFYDEDLDIPYKTEDYLLVEQAFKE